MGKIQHSTHFLSLFLIRDALHNMLGRTGIAAVLGKEKARNGAQNPVLVLSCIAVNTVGKMVSLFLYDVQRFQADLPLCGGFFHLRAVFVDIHVLVRMAEQFPDITVFKFRGQCIASGVADRHLRVLAGIFCRLRADVIHARFHFFAVQSAQNGKKLISAVSSDEILLRDCFSKLNGKGTDIFVSLVVTQTVVDRAQIVEVKHADRIHAGNFFSSVAFLQNLFAFIFIWQARRLIEIDFLLQNTVHRRIADGLDQLHADDKHQTDDISYYHLLKLLQRRRHSLRIRFRKARRLVTDFEKGLTLFDNRGILISFFTHQKNLCLQLFKIRCQLSHLILKIPVIQAHQIQLAASVLQTVDISVDVCNHRILRFSRILQLDNPLRFSAHQTGIVDNAGRSLYFLDHRHNAEKQNNQNDRQNRHCGFGNKRCFFLTFLFLHRSPSDPVSFFVI